MGFAKLYREEALRMIGQAAVDGCPVSKAYADRVLREMDDLAADADQRLAERGLEWDSDRRQLKRLPASRHFTKTPEDGP